ncbi:hypothetical protein ESA94_07865 [Lacibacter luteus]|uniref:Uncharacterized protein n=1 Tax=Lacibacter luteus TaxID=2508719 RepID=A0A4Q1CJ70_9BACT|nr:hypothetical protein [Lacibacter luteus]RXK60377.1 hypothetical protein ESA94_07865 [Lacibacter luteus]
MSKLSNYQLFEIIQNNSLDRVIRNEANAEFDKREISVDEISQLISTHDSLYKPDKETGLDLKYKIILVVFPFFIFLHNIIAAIILDKRKEYKFKQYWLYLSIGYVLWTAIVILFARYNLFKTESLKG